MRKEEIMKFYFSTLIDLFCYRFDRCTECHKVLEMKETVIDSINYITCESKYECKNCHIVQDYFAYGSYERRYWKHEVEKIHPYWTKFLNLFRPEQRIPK